MAQKDQLDVCERVYDLGEEQAQESECPYFERSITQFLLQQLGHDGLREVLERKGGNWELLHDGVSGKFSIFSTDKELREKHSAEVDYERQLAGIV